MYFFICYLYVYHQKKCMFLYDFEIFIKFANNLIDQTLYQNNFAKITCIFHFMCQIWILFCLLIYWNLCTKMLKIEICFVSLLCTIKLITINVNEYFSTIIKNWYDITLQEFDYDRNNINITNTFFDELTHCTMYFVLKTTISNHIFNENESKLNLCIRSTKKKLTINKNLCTKTKKIHMIKKWILLKTKSILTINCL